MSSTQLSTSHIDDFRRSDAVMTKSFSADGRASRNLLPQPHAIVELIGSSRDRTSSITRPSSTDRPGSGDGGGDEVGIGPDRASNNALYDVMSSQAHN